MFTTGYAMVNAGLKEAGKTTALISLYLVVDAGIPIWKIRYAAKSSCISYRSHQHLTIRWTPLIMEYTPLKIGYTHRKQRDILLKMRD